MKHVVTSVKNTNINKASSLTCYDVPIAVLGAVLLLLSHIPGGRLALEEALYHQQQTKQSRKENYTSWILNSTTPSRGKKDRFTLLVLFHGYTRGDIMLIGYKKNEDHKKKKKVCSC